MNTITFNKSYTKLPAGIKTAMLVACEPVRLPNQTESFMFFDTEYIMPIGDNKALADLFKNWVKKCDDDYLCLVLKSDSGAIFTTLRKDNRENREKYMNLKIGSLGQYWEPRYRRVFEIIIKEG